MKYVILILSGMTDEPCDELGGKTPLQVAKTPQLDELAARGVVGNVQLVPENTHAGNENAMLSLLGYDSQAQGAARGPLEALGMNASVDKNDVIFRCNLVTVNASKLLDHAAGRIETKEASMLIDALNRSLKDEKRFFQAGQSYRHLLVLKNSKESSNALGVECIPPHDLINKKYRSSLPKRKGRKFLLDLINRSRKILEDQDINKVRIDLNENPANMIWLWGQGRLIDVPSFETKYGLKGSLIAATHLMKGVGRLVGLDVFDVSNATGYEDTDFLGKAETGVESLKNGDMTVIHVNAAEEASLMGDLKRKIQAIENFDSQSVAAVRKYLEGKTDLRILVCSNYASPLALRTNIPAPALFLMAGQGIEPDSGVTFCEAAGALSKLRYTKGHNLIGRLLAKSTS